jgi:putative MATE family efflux protein
MIYNMGSGILRAVGDSKCPFYFLVVAAIINTVLDLVFVIVFKLGVAGVAYATIISQGISAILVMVTLFRSQSCVRLSLRKLKLSFDILMKIVKVGFPAALQMAITSFSNVFVQSYINHFGNDVMSGWTAYSKIDQLLLLPMQSIALSSTTFVGQNLGKNQSERAKKGVRTALLLGITSTLILMVPVLIFAPYLVSFFYSRAEVIESGTLLLRLISPFYVLCCFNQIYAGALRGSGNTRAPMIIMLVSFVAFRQLYLFVVANFISNTIIWISMSYPAGWLLASALTMLYYKHTDLTSKVEIAEPKAAEVN